MSVPSAVIAALILADSFILMSLVMVMMMPPTQALIGVTLPS